MSYNQSTPDGSDNQQYRRSTGYHQQQQQPHGSSPASYGRGTGAGAVSLSVPNKHNGPNEHSRSQVAGASGGPANPSSGAIPKAPTSHSPTAKAPGDPFKAFAFQFRSLGPDSVKISAPPNMDEQQRAQTPYQHPHVPHPTMHMQPPYVAPTSFQMPMPMALSMGNTPQFQQQVFSQGLPSHPMHQAQGHGFVTPVGAQIHPQLGVGASPHTPPMQVMHKAEKKYQVGAVAEEAKRRKFKGILNKLTPQNFEKLLEQVKSVNIDNAFTLIGVVSQIFDKALMEPNFGEMYADLCFHLSGALPDINEDGEKITFKKLLINKCQKEFERGEKEEEDASRVAEEGQVEQTEDEREEKRLNVRRRKLCNIGLIGELYKKRMLTEKIMHGCIQKLLGDDQDPHEENIEALCKLMSTIGVRIDHHKAKVHIDAYFERMKMLSCKQELSSRVRFMLINVMDLRKNKWQERMKVEGTKKIEEVHRERNTQANRLSRGPSMNSSARRGHMEYSPRGGGGMLSPPRVQMGGFHGPPQGRGSQRPATQGRSNPRGRGSTYVHREFASASRASDTPSEVSSARQVLEGPSSAVNSPRENALSEERLHDMSLSAIKEYYSARDEEEIGLCMKDINSPAFHPTMISLWVTDSFERKDKERDLLAKLLVNLVKSADNALTEVQLVKGFESVLTTLEDAVNDAPKAAEYLGRIFGKSVMEKVVTLTEIGRLIREGGEEPGSLLEFGLGGDVLESVLEMIKTEAGEEALVEIRRSSGLRIGDFKPPAPNRSKILDKFT